MACGATLLGEADALAAAPALRACLAGDNLGLAPPTADPLRATCNVARRIEEALRGTAGLKLFVRPGRILVKTRAGRDVRQARGQRRRRPGRQHCLRVLGARSPVSKPGNLDCGQDFAQLRMRKVRQQA
jgi:hypothetical protein